MKAVYVFKSLCVASSLLSGSLLLGCAVDLDDGGHDAQDEESLGEVESALSIGRGAWAWGTTNGPSFEIGSATNQTCFLAGVSGNLNEGWGWDHGGRSSVAGVGISGGNWWLTAHGGWGYDDVVLDNPVNAHAVCISTAANREFYYQGGPGGSVNYKKVLEPVAANRQCFLSSLSGFAGTWSASNARVKLIQENGDWVLESANLGVDSGIPRIGAVCVDIPAGTWVGTGNWGAGNPGSNTFDILTEGSNKGVCGLTGVEGPLKYDDWDDGALINWPEEYPDPGVWTLRVEDGKRGFVTCLL